jgi:hypothetical protein
VQGIAMANAQICRQPRWNVLLSEQSLNLSEPESQTVVYEIENVTEKKMLC